jgi:hypothetical protein
MLNWLHTGSRAQTEALFCKPYNERAMCTHLVVADFGSRRRLMDSHEYHQEKMGAGTVQCAIQMAREKILCEEVCQGRTVLMDGSCATCERNPTKTDEEVDETWMLPVRVKSSPRVLEWVEYEYGNQRDGSQMHQGHGCFPPRVNISSSRVLERLEYRGIPSRASLNMKMSYLLFLVV